ncbi:MAG TPA: hypothetical protein VEK31_04280 [Xanthobacteraceae bacterium]|nr:hypothetical protein [Xanthobacteraceae bacterium]
MECHAPLNAGQKHGDLNSAVFYVLKGVEAFEWRWAKTPKKSAWTRGDYVYIPPLPFSVSVAMV